LLQLGLEGIHRLVRIALGDGGGEIQGVGLQGALKSSKLMAQSFIGVAAFFCSTTSPSFLRWAMASHLSMTCFCSFLTTSISAAEANLSAFFGRKP
jgi:hypothetical protein